MRGDFSVEDVKPTAHAVKHQEMAIRRAYELNEGMLTALAMHGTIEVLKKQHRWAILSVNQLRKLFPYTSIEYKEAEMWCWVVDHWYSGALKRSVEASLENITSTNRKNIKQKVEALHG